MQRAFSAIPPVALPTLTRAAGASMMPAVWREEDEALCARLTDEVVLERVLRALATEDPIPVPRAAGLFAALRKTPGGDALVDAAFDGPLDPVLSLLEPARHVDAPPELLHHLALFHAHVARFAPGRTRGSTDARVNAITAWLALARDTEYVRELGETVAGPAMPREELGRALAEVPLWPIEDLGALARKGARDLTGEGADAIGALRRVSEAAALARARGGLEERAVARATSLIAMAVDEALSPILEAFAEASARDAPQVKQSVELLERIGRVWSWSGGDEAAEHAAIEQATPIAWIFYRASRWDDLRALCAPIERLVDSLERRIIDDPMKLAYAARVAQMLVFRSDVVRTEAETMALLERAVAICPTHRNARLMIANTLLDQALRVLPGAKAPTHRDYESAKMKIERAEKTYPASNRLDEAKKRLEQAAKLLGVRA